MDTMFRIFVFVFGAIVGSFLNVVILRKNTGESIIFGSSRCFSCGKSLGALEMIPILSFLWQKGKCKGCESGISPQYLLVEFLVGVLSLLVFFHTNFQFSIFNFQSTFNFQTLIKYIFYFSAFSALFLVAAYDFRQKIIDSHFLYIFGAFAVTEMFLRSRLNLSQIVWDLASSFAIALFFYLMWRISSGRWMGRGDADLAFFTSLFLGFYLNIIGLLISFWVGGVLGIILLLFKGKKYSLKSEIPFGPFLALGTFIVWFLSDYFLYLYI